MAILDCVEQNVDINKISEWSRIYFIKQCDICKKKMIRHYCDIKISRKRRNSTLDFCYKCAMASKKGDNNVAKRPDVKEKISKALKGKSKSFKDGKDLRILGKKMTANGYVMVYDENKKKYILEQRKIIEDNLKRELISTEKIYHINGEKVKNEINNLVLCDNESEHQKIHQNLIKIAFDLVNNNVIKFNKKTKEYYINPEMELSFFPMSFNFKDIAILQEKNICNSRLDTNISSEIIRGIKRNIPLIASNMSTVVNSDFIIKLYKLGALGVMHRALSYDKLEKEIRNIAKECDVVCASIGIENDQFDLCKKLISIGTNVIFIDVAHGYSERVIELGKKIKKEFSDIKVVLGDTINPDMLYEIYDFADALKIGIGNGQACETKNTAACNEGQFTSVFKFKQLSKKFGIPVISDGGTREPADFTKAIAAGANSVMAGKIFARCPESAAPRIEIDGKIKKIYAGMASRYVQESWRGGVKSGTCPEGKMMYVEIGETVEDLLERYSGALRTGITYVGATDINSFQKNVKFTIIK